jgi:tetratricopeptide (TPR) repeat protein
VTALPLRRRIVCSVVALGAATLVLRGPLAEAVVTRGDDAIRIGDVSTALRSYRKALTLDPDSIVAADRLSFQLALRHRPTDAEAAVRVATDALRRHPGTVALLADRGFAQLQLKHWTAARADFTSAGAMATDLRYTRLAARIALQHALP